MNLFNLTLARLAALAIVPLYVVQTEAVDSIEFRYQGWYYAIEFLPVGEIALVRKKGNHIDGWDLRPDTYLDTLYSTFPC